MKGRPETWDHPRSRGVYAISCAPVTRVAGSSPLARGLLVCFGCASCLAGIIPARAGFTYRCRRGHWYVQDHPRSRGVYSTPAFPASKNGGSSPLARGLLANSLPCGNHAGIIPARAGFTVSRTSTREHKQDHPRSRGVYGWVFWFWWCSDGSSPLARGLPTPRTVPCSTRRIIPARAGFTAPGGSPPSRHADHPRSRGVYSRSPCRGAGRWDHPRSRGVYWVVLSTLSACDGSSPLARGLLVWCASRFKGSRIIPARAGFTRGRHPCIVLSPDHPRSRGVYLIRSIMLLFVPGSSPLARGLQVVQRGLVFPARIIPARAGFTPMDCG